MSPLLATVLCIGYIFLLLWRDRKEFGPISKTLWVPVIWFAIISTKPIGLWFISNGEQADINYSLDGSPLDRTVFLFLIILGLLILAKRRLSWGRVLSGNVAITLLFGYLALSVVWSDYSFIAFKRWSKDFGSLVMILVVLTERQPNIAVRQTIIRCALVSIPLSVLMCKYYVTIGTGFNVWTGQEYYRGVTASKNQLGRLAMISGIFLAWDATNVVSKRGWVRGAAKRLPEIGVLLGCCWLLLKSNSATSKACFAAAGFALLASRLNIVRRNPGLIPLSGLAFIALALMFFFVPDLRELLTARLGRGSDFTQRTEVWQKCLAFHTNPVIGTGYASFWLLTGGIQIGFDRIGEAHNGYLETYLNSGFIGVFLLVIAILAASRNGFRHFVADSALGPLFLSLIVLAFMYNFTEAAFFDLNIVGFCMWLAGLNTAFAAEHHLQAHDQVEVRQSVRPPELQPADSIVIP